MSSLTDWADPRTGLYSSPEPGPGPWPLPGLVHRHRARVHLPDGPLTVAGAALGDEVARASCLGEAWERYGASHPRPADLVASPRSLLEAGRPHLTPHSLGGPAETDTAIEWLTATDTRLVPRPAAALLPHQPPPPGGPRRTGYPQGSTGLAAGQHLRQAIENAAAEVVERDTVARAWRTRRLAPTLPDGVLEERLLRATRAAGLEMVVHLLPTAPGPEVAVVGLRDPGRGLLGVGASYRPHRRMAATKAWLEAVVSLAQAAELLDPTIGPALCATAGLDPWRSDRRYAEPGWAHVADLSRHVQLLLDPELAAAVWERLTGPALPAARARPDVGARSLLADLFTDVVEVELTPADLRAADGPVVVRVLAVGASTVRPAGCTPEDLPCPLI
ncbi:YcaO-like family protein [Nocardioides limicola]|uniref:YcaO-like family protein n=1 Tax=Nocardioides limicola TaxID=2803368 RepID=UPI00193B8577|nr:YcaO-like family protein [Nocardioides sp. DJM-14]